MSAKLAFCFPNGYKDLDPGPVSAGCQLLSLQLTLVGGLRKGWLIQNYNSAFHATYLRLMSLSFLRFQSLLRFMKSQFGVTSSFLIKSSSSQNQIFNKKQNSYVSSFLVSCLIHYSLVLLFYTPWKLQKTFRFSDVFRGYRKATPGCNGLKPFVADFTFITLLLSQIYVCARILTDCLMCPAINDDISKRVNIFSKFLFLNVTKLIFIVTSLT